MITPTPSKLAAIELGLRAYLLQETGLAFDNYGVIVQPGVDPIALCRVAVSRAANEMITDWWQTRAAIVTIRLVMAGSNPAEIDSSLKNWAEFIDDKVKLLNDTGVSGTFGGTVLEREAVPIRPSIQGFRFQLDPVSGQQDTSTTLWQAVVIWEYSVPYQKTYY